MLKEEKKPKVDSGWSFEVIGSDGIGTVVPKVE
jgi:hypothetical protein